jgi:hypothetical protein
MMDLNKGRWERYLPSAQSFHMSKIFPGPFLQFGFSEVNVESLDSNLWKI